MIDFDLEKLSEILKNVYSLSHVKVSIYNAEMKEIAYYPEKLCPFCALVRKNEKGDKACSDSDIAHLNLAKKTREIQKFVCPHGLTEAFAPILIGDDVVGYILIGQFLNQTTSIEELLERTIYLGIDKKALEETIEEIPIIERSKFDSTIFLLNLAIKYIVLSDSIKILKNKDMEAIEKYIDDHLCEEIKTVDLCRLFYMSRSSLYACFKKYFNDSVRNFITNKKLDFASAFLKSDKEMEIAELAEKIKIEPNYFSKLFKKRFGMAPKKYQKAYI